MGHQLLDNPLKSVVSVLQVHARPEQVFVEQKLDVSVHRSERVGLWRCRPTEDGLVAAYHAYSDTAYDRKIREGFKLVGAERYRCECSNSVGQRRASVWLPAAVVFCQEC
jgi:hypothetical protein